MTFYLDYCYVLFYIFNYIKFIYYKMFIKSNGYFNIMFNICYVVNKKHRKIRL